MKAWWVGGILLGCALTGAVANAQPYGVPPGYRPYENQSIRLRAGLFTPDGDSAFWDQNRVDLTGDANDFQDWTGGVDYTVDIMPNFALMFSVDEFEGALTQSYRNFSDNFGHRVAHDTTLDIVPLRAGIMVKLAPPRSPVVPYVGAGGGIYFWDYTEEGDFIDFTQHNLPVFSDRLEDSGTAFGYYFLAGLEVPISHNMSVLAEGRWDKADDDFSQDFEGFPKIDLSGKSVVGGLSFRF